MRFYEELAIAILAASAVCAWETEQMPEKVRKELCAEQVLFCTNVCGGEGQTKEAFCNTNTLGSKCTCTNGAEAAIRRNQWPAFHRVCEAMRSECRYACDHNSMGSGDKSTCFTNCDTNLACSTEKAPELKVMVQKYDDPTVGSKPKPKVSDLNGDGVLDANNGEGASVIIANKDSKIKERKGGKEGGPKRRGGPLPTGTNGSASISASGWMIAALPAVVALAGGGSGFI
ncbi:hypothetical protein GGI25_001494 [Coemansia spiralis]|uniref:DUF7707 domain-containing protein n=2 Tax=Coemansia TaxID=4863 RepID=A0A9W8KZW7_9FUNG|nr:hypothetical protein BX070DRAFT_219208 [Coemansia spiralis]KAJ1994453.1 hypothetical protein EDC05_001652 [Coemansia umbellata]KAJ2624234.1 hypothetical protein GGI26_001590 [Coemansia sp. RSA 1358]KAJ2679359.1 hypothetical protein GGI25_001494 [Coemansia spiralis]